MTVAQITPSPEKYTCPAPPDVPAHLHFFSYLDKTANILPPSLSPCLSRSLSFFYSLPPLSLPTASSVCLPLSSSLLPFFLLLPACLFFLPHFLLPSSMSVCLPPALSLSPFLCFPLTPPPVCFPLFLPSYFPLSSLSSLSPSIVVFLSCTLFSFYSLTLPFPLFLLLCPF